MNLFSDIPKIFKAFFGLVLGIKAISFINSIDYGISGKLDENLEKTTGFIVDNIVPTEIDWISWVTDKINNPWILLISILGIFWLFGYYPPKNN